MAIFLSSKEMGSLLSMTDYIETIERAYCEMGKGKVSMLPRINVDSAQIPGFLKILPACLSSWDAAGIHVYSMGGGGSFSKIILLFNINSGSIEAIIESDRISWLVPGATCAVATKYLAKKEARVMGMLGSGRQARSQLLAISCIRNLEMVKVYSPNKDHLEHYCKEMSDLINLRIVPVSSAKEAIDGSDIISTTTNSSTPIFDGNWVEPGTHINAVGAHYPNRREIDTVCIKRSKVIVDSTERALKEQGELLIPMDEGVLQTGHIDAELGEILAGKKVGRLGEKDITLFLLGGVAISYVAIAVSVYQKAQRDGVGQELSVERDFTIPKSLYSKRG